MGNFIRQLKLQSKGAKNRVRNTGCGNKTNNMSLPSLAILAPEMRIGLLDIGIIPQEPTAKHQITHVSNWVTTGYIFCAVDDDPQLYNQIISITSS